MVYVVSIVNDGAADLTGVTVTDDLGGYDFEGTTVYPLAYAEGSLLYFADGVLQTAPAAEAGPPLAISGLEIPAGSNAVLVYEARVTEFAPLGEGAEISNTVTVEGGCIADPVVTAATLPYAQEPALSITKTVNTDSVAGCSELSYDFVIQNTGGAPADAEAAITVADTFLPVLHDIVVTLQGETLTAGTDYTYDETAGLFQTAAGVVTVAAATFGQNDDGSWMTTPGVTVLTVSGTV